MKKPDSEKPIYRFPRTDNVIILSVAGMRAKYPPPVYNWRFDGSMNPADMILQSLVKLTRKKLRKLCEKHSMETWGNRRRLIHRMYLHWRASKLGEGDPQIGYGKGFECIGTPTCTCGFIKRAEVIAWKKRKEEEAEMRRKQRCRVEELWRRALDKNYKRRFPRLRFPRFKDPQMAKEYYKNFERMIL